MPMIMIDDGAVVMVKMMMVMVMWIAMSGLFGWFMFEEYSTYYRTIV
jgi:hypothetical protein